MNLEPNMRIRILSFRDYENPTGKDIWIEYLIHPRETPKVQPDGCWAFSARPTGGHYRIYPMIVEPERIKIVR